MVKKTIIAIAALVILAAVFVGASHRYLYYYPHYSYPQSYRYYYSYPYYTAPYYVSPYYGYPYNTRQSYAYPYYYSPLSSESMYRYGTPQVSYPTYYTASTGQGAQGQACGIIYGQTYGCQYGLVCDYSKSGIADIGVCSSQ